MTDEDRVARLERAVCAIAELLTRNYPLRAHEIGFADVKAIVADVRVEAEELAAAQRRQALEDELASLKAVA